MAQSEFWNYVVYDACNNPIGYHMKPKAALRACRRYCTIHCHDEGAGAALDAVEPALLAAKASRLARLRDSKSKNELRLWEARDQHGEVCIDINKLRDHRIREAFLGAEEVLELGTFRNGFFAGASGSDAARLRSISLDSVKAASFLINKILLEVPRYFELSHEELVE